LSTSSILQDNASSTFRNAVVIGRALAAFGIDSDEVLQEAGIDLEDYVRTKKRVPYRSMDKLYRLVVERTGDPSIGLDLAEFVNPTVYEAMGVALLCSSTLRNFFRRFERYFDVVTTLESGRFYDTDYGGYFATHPNVDYRAETFGCHADVFSAVILKLMRLVYVPDYTPRRVDLAWTPPVEYQHRYPEFFGCEVVFSAPLTAIHVDSGDLDIPLPGKNANLAFQNDQLAKVVLSDLKQDSLQSQVYSRLIEFLPAGECSREKVASSLFMSESAFQKKLNAEGSSYQEILDRTRSELAQHYLGKGGMSISETAFLLGFTDSSNFSRAFKRWLGISPSDFREAQTQSERK